MSQSLRLSERPQALFLLLFVLCGAGVWTATRLPSAIFPTVTFPRVKVIAEGAEEPAAQMIPAVTRPLEEAILRVPGIERVISTTTRGSVEISAEFSWGTDMQLALQRAQAEIARTRPGLPADLRIDAEWMNTAVFPVLGYALTSDTFSQAALRELADYQIRPALIQISGVSQVQVQGGALREFQVRLDPARLAARKLSVSDVVDGIRKNNVLNSSGLVEANHELYLSLVTGKPAGLEELGRISIAPPKGGVAASLSQLGEIVPADAVSFVRTTADRRPAVLVNVVRQPAASTLAIASQVDALLKERPELLPTGVKWTTFYDQAEYIRHSVNGVRDAILIGIALAALVLFVYLRSFKITAVAVATIPVTVAIVLLALGVTGQTINLMTLGGIAAAIGLVVDDAIVVVENIARHAEDRVSENPARSGLAEALPPLTGSSLSTIVIFFPFALLSGVAGAFFRPLALTMAIALAVSYVLSALAVPSAAQALGVSSKAPRKKREPKIARFFIRHPSLALAVTGGLLVGGFLLYSRIGSDFLPGMDEGSIILDYWTPAGTSLTETSQMLDQLEKIIVALPDVASYSRRTGTELGFFVTEPNRGDYVIRLKPRRQRRGVEAIIDELRAKVDAEQPAVRAEFGQILEDNIGDLAGGVAQPIDVKIYGEDQAILQEKAGAAARILSGVTGVEDVFNGVTVAGPKVTVRATPEALPRFGFTAETLLGEVEPALGGTVAGTLRIQERLYNIRVFSRRTSDIMSLPQLPIQTPSGALVPLSVLASVSTGTPEVEIHRENLRTYLGVTARLAGRDLGSAISEIRQKLSHSLALPTGMSLQFGGLYEQQQNSFKGLLGVLFGGLLLVAVVLLFEFGDWRAPLLTVVVALTVLTSVLGSLILTGMTLNISSFVGAIMMVGIVGEKAVFLIHDAREELRKGIPVPEAWAEASRKRVRAVMMTIFATAFALAPLALALGEGSQLQQPLAVAVIGGFILSSPLVLLILPSLYCWLDPRGRLAGRQVE
ncbi:MAG TPA: efflux RND transporter permease subunit [Thermoanaerobaculia bacterium]|nr:efflux RND transporter permease subunit [Thermoanaerobaculia bacterium]